MKVFYYTRLDAVTTASTESLKKHVSEVVQEDANENEVSSCEQLVEENDNFNLQEKPE